MTPLGLHSPHLERVRALKTKAGRRDQGRFAVEGPTMLTEALEAGTAIEEIFATEAALERLGALGRRLPEPLYVVPEKAAARISDLESPTGLLAVLKQTPANPAALMAGGRPLVVLAGVADPGNAGTLLRSAEIFGFGGAIFSSDGVEPYNPKVVRGSMGAILRLPVALADAEALRSAARAAGYTIIASAGSGEPISGFCFPERTILAVGNERRGLAGWVLQSDPSVAIPQQGHGESLNAAVAGSIIMYVLTQQRGSGEGAASI